MSFTVTPEILMGGLAIFLLRVFDMSLDTLRVLFVVRGKKLPVWILGVIQSSVFVVAIGQVLSGNNNAITILCYACGYATGNVLGIYIEDRLAIGFRQVSIISQVYGETIADTLRKAGFGVTELCGKGKDGAVCIVNCNVKRKQVSEVEKIVATIDPAAFVTEDDFNPTNRSGYWRK